MESEFLESLNARAAATAANSAEKGNSDKRAAYRETSYRCGRGLLGVAAADRMRETGRQGAKFYAQCYFSPNKLGRSLLRRRCLVTGCDTHTHTDTRKRVTSRRIAS